MRASTAYMGIVVPSSIIIPIIFALFKHRLWTLSEKLSFCYLLLSATFNTLAIITAIKKINNLPFLHLYTVLEFCLLCFVLRSILEKNNFLLRKALKVASFTFPIFAVVYILLTNSLYTFNVLPRFLSSIILLIFCLATLFSGLSKIEKTISAFNFQAIVALLIYFSSSSVLFGLIEYVRTDKELNRILWCMHATLVLFMYLIFARAYYKISSQQ